MPTEDEPVRTFRLSMQSLPPAKSSLLVLSDQPEAVQEMAGVNLTEMAVDLLGLLTEAEHEMYNRQSEVPLGPMAEAPKIEIDLDRTESIALAHSLLGVRYATDGPMKDLLLKAMAEFYYQIPSEWVDDVEDPLAKSIQAVKSTVKEK